MTLDLENSVKAGNKDKPTGRARDRQNRRERAKPLTKVIIRRLPPTMTEEEFLKQIDPLPDHDNYYFVPADWSLGFDATCRAYITFTNPDDVFLFRDRFDGYVFVDNKGAEYPAVVEYAPFQGLPKNKSRKKDPKANSMESDPHYISFLEKLLNEENEIKSDLKMEFSLQPKDDKKMISTPLLQYLAEKKMARRDERKKRAEEKQRQRQEEKQVKKILIAKSIPPAIKEEDGKSDSKDSKDGVKNKDEKSGKRERADDHKTRSQRRAERDQKRRLERDQRDKARREANKDRTQSKSSEKPEKSTPTPPVQSNPVQSNVNAAPAADGKRRDVKKYSERRDRMRAKNESKTSELKESNSSTKEGEATPVAAAPKSVEEVSDNVKNFIKNIAMIKEFVPKDKERKLVVEETVQSVVPDETKENLNAVAEELKKIALQDIEEPLPKSEEKDIEGGISAEKPKRDSSSSANGNDKREERNARRIRNKDRPSLQIYQPKLRSRKISDESGRSSAEPKDTKSNPISDNESVKKEDTTSARRRVSRYSERRSSRTKTRTTPTSEIPKLEDETHNEEDEHLEEKAETADSTEQSAEDKE